MSTLEVSLRRRRVAGWQDHRVQPLPCLPLLRSTYLRAADAAHERAAERHEQSAELFDGMGSSSLAREERARARFERERATIERDRALARREWNASIVAERAKPPTI